MNVNILNKCIEELKKDNPDLSYLRGILETLVDSVPAPLGGYHVPLGQGFLTGTTLAVGGTDQIELTDEEKLATRYANGPVAEL